MLPVFANADPTTVELDAMELDLSPDGSGGYNALVRGEIPPANALAALAPGVIQMIANDPADHVELSHDLDANRDGKISPDEVMKYPLIGALVGDDITVSNKPMSSLGFAAHLVPCPAGGCAAPPSNTCFDRLRDGNETDVDCGGSCGRCAPGAACAVGADCQLGACDSGACRGPSCSDGVQNGFETDVDCGWNCTPCATGERCGTGADCASGICRADCTGNTTVVCSPATCR